eukprot:SAG11_NODE_32739_length_281_cov_0.840659_1_plen_39_part_10
MILGSLLRIRHLVKVDGAREREREKLCFLKGGDTLCVQT